MKDVIKFLGQNRDGTESTKKLLKITCLWYSIWHIRNEVQFGCKPNIREMVAKFEQVVEEFGRVLAKTPPITKPKAMISWKPPKFGTIAINADASVGNGSFAWAMVGRDHTGKLVFFSSRWGTGSTPLEAECKALAWAAKIAFDYGWQEMEWRSDAMAIINQVVC